MRIQVNLDIDLDDEYDDAHDWFLKLIDPSLVDQHMYHQVALAAVMNHADKERSMYRAFVKNTKKEDAHAG